MALLMLTWLHESYKSLVVTLTYGKSSITSSKLQKKCYYLMMNKKRKLSRKVLLLVLVMNMG
jgi:hypothetical protein